jgi:hypothetical protein
MSTEKLIDDRGNVAVLYSPGYGAGWSTWAHEHEEEMIFDRELAQAVQKNAPLDELTAIAERKWPGVYTGGLDQIVIEWVPQGTRFEIHEYDGNESVRIFHYMPGYTA